MDHSSCSAPAHNLLHWFLAPRLDGDTGLAQMRRTAEELRDRCPLLRSALSVLLHDGTALAAFAARSSLHRNGFAKIVLSRGNDWSLRLHVWSPSVKSVGGNLHPHGHRWAFASWIITGTLREITFVEGRRGQVFLRYDYHHDAGQTWNLRRNGRTTLVAGEQVDRRAGTVYGRTGAEVHTAVPRSELVATLVLQGPHRTDTTEVFLAPDNLGQLDDEHEDEALAVEDLRRLVTEVLAELP